MTAFADLHIPGKPFVLVNAWDVASALLLAADGHTAIGTTSLGITAADGVLDGAREGLALTVALAAKLQGRLAVPLTVDLEDGFSDDPAEVVDLVITLAALGVAGINLEDAGRSAKTHAAIVTAVKAAVPDMFVNARCDEFWSGSGEAAEAMARLAAYRDAGADGLFVPGLTDRGGIEAVCRLGPPVNVLSSAAHSPKALGAVGVARISTGSGPYRYALAAARDAAAAARDGREAAGTAIPYAETQALLS